MAIQNRKEIETISVYDPTLGAYHEISLEKEAERQKPKKKNLSSK